MKNQRKDSGPEIPGARPKMPEELRKAILYHPPKTGSLPEGNAVERRWEEKQRLELGWEDDPREEEPEAT